MTNDAQVQSLLGEVVLAPEIRPPHPRADGSRTGRIALLTGVTGFVGAHVLPALLERGVEHVFCLVRARDEMEAALRVSAALEKYDLDCAAPRPRWSGVPGDLAASRLGLERGRFDELAEEVDTVVHAGAWVHLEHPYHVLRATNVGGTHEILRFAVDRRPKRICHLSGTSVFLDASEMLENAPPPCAPGSHGGYLDTKWVSERLVWKAFDRGVAGAVVRLGWISGDSRQGLIAESDALTLFLQACVRLGAAPAFDDDGILCTPVDFAADVIASVALDGAEHVRGYNLASTHLLTFADLYAACRAAGLSIEVQPREDWLDLLERRLPMLRPIARSVMKDWNLPPLQNDLALAALRETKREVSSQQLISTYLPVWRRRRPAVLRRRAREEPHG